jgi:hypothetical protein
MFWFEWNVMRDITFSREVKHVRPILAYTFISALFLDASLSVKIIISLLTVQLELKC